MRLVYAILVIMVSVLAMDNTLAQERVTPKTSWVEVPDTTPQPIPAPVPVPGTIPRIKDQEWYIINCSEPCFILVSPPGIVSVTQDAGPIKMRGWFYGGSGKAETRTFTGKVVFTVEAVGTGRVELMVVKDGAKTPADVFRQLLDANVGPLPPPPGPGPKPPPPPDPVVPDKLGFVALAKSQAQQVHEASRGLASQLADNFESTAAKLAATAGMTIDQANAEMVQKNRTTLGGNRAAWLPWFQAWQALAEKHNQSGAMTTKEHYVTAYQETATGLRQVR